MRGHARLSPGAGRERVRRGAERPCLVQRLGARLLRTQRAGQHRERHERRRSTPSPGDAATPARRFGAQHPQHLRQLGAELCRVAQATRAVARRPQPVAQPHDVIRHRALDPRRAQRPRQPIPIACPRVGDVARQHAVELPLQPPQPAGPRRSSPAVAPGAPILSQLVVGGDLARGAAPPQPSDERRPDQQRQPAPRREIARQGVAPHLRRAGHQGWQRARGARLRTWRDRQRAGRGGRGAIRARGHVVVRVTDLGQQKRAGGVGDNQIVKGLRPRDPAVARLHPHARLAGVRAEARRPADSGLGPERHVAHPREPRRHVDRLADPAVRRIDHEVERQSLRCDALVSSRGPP